MEPFDIQPMNTEQVSELFGETFSSASQTLGSLPWQQYLWIGFLLVLIITIIISGILTYHWGKYELEKIKHAGIQLFYYIGVVCFLVIIGITILTI